MAKEENHTSGGLSISDSGNRQEFDTGARRDTSEGKGFYVYFPANAFLALTRISVTPRDPLDGALNGFFGFLRDSSDQSQLIAAALYALRSAQPEIAFEAGCKGFLGLPYGPVHQLAQLFEAGAKKYGDTKAGPYRQNWQKGMPVSRYLDSGIRHMFKHLAGDKADPHLICAAWNALCAYETLDMIQRGKLPRELDDMPADTNPYVAVGMITEKDGWVHIKDNVDQRAAFMLFPDDCPPSRFGDDQHIAYHQTSSGLFWASSRKRRYYIVSENYTTRSEAYADLVRQMGS